MAEAPTCPAGQCREAAVCFPGFCLVACRLDRVRDQAERLVAEALRSGVVLLTIEQCPAQPLAMGHYQAQVRVWPTRVRSAA